MRPDSCPVVEIPRRKVSPCWETFLGAVARSCTSSRACGRQHAIVSWSSAMARVSKVRQTAQPMLATLIDAQFDSKGPVQAHRPD
jgi:hypothetical protein